MSDNEDISGLQSRLERQKNDLRKDTAQIKEKVREARTQLSPTNLLEQRIFLFSGLAFALGFALGRRGVSVKEFGKPAARAALMTAGKQAATRAISGKQA